MRALALSALVIVLTSPALACSGSSSGEPSSPGGITMNMVYAQGDTRCGGTFAVDAGGVTSQPKKGTVSFSSPRFDYTAKPGATGTDRFVISGTKGGKAVKATVNVTLQ